MKSLLFILVFSLSCTHTAVFPDGKTVEIVAEDMANPAGFSMLGKWMLSPAKTPADWLGGIYRRKGLREPINIVITDAHSTSAAQAIAKLTEACVAAGYRARLGHSAGYSAIIGGVVFEQLADESHRAFSDAYFGLSNNHGRIFGPYFDGTKFIFTGAFSRENVSPLAKVKHGFVSFNQARDSFAQNLDDFTDYKISDFLALGNYLIKDTKIGTGDHDGLAVLLISRK